MRPLVLLLIAVLALLVVTPVDPSPLARFAKGIRSMLGAANLPPVSQSTRAGGYDAAEKVVLSLLTVIPGESTTTSVAAAIKHQVRKKMARRSRSIVQHQHRRLVNDRGAETDQWVDERMQTATSSPRDAASSRSHAAAKVEAARRRVAAAKQQAIFATRVNRAGGPFPAPMTTAATKPAVLAEAAAGAGSYSAGQYSSDQSSANQYSSAQSSGNQYSSAQSSTNQYSSAQSSANQYSSAQSSTNQYSANQYSGQYSADQCSADQSSAARSSSLTAQSSSSAKQPHSQAEIRAAFLRNAVSVTAMPDAPSNVQTALRAAVSLDDAPVQPGRPVRWTPPTDPVPTENVKGHRVADVTQVEIPVFEVPSFNTDAGTPMQMLTFPSLTGGKPLLMSYWNFETIVGSGDRALRTVTLDEDDVIHAFNNAVRDADAKKNNEAPSD